MTEQRALTTQNELPRVEPRWRSRENDAGFELVVELPGVSEEALELRYEDGFLSIEGEVRRAGDVAPQHAEFGDRRLGLKLSLDKRIDAEAIAARLERGLLTVSLPKRAEARTRTVPVQV